MVLGDNKIIFEEAGIESPDPLTDKVHWRGKG